MMDVAAKIGQKLGEIVFLGHIGSGAYGQVYLAYDPRSVDYYAVKCLAKKGLNGTQLEQQRWEIHVNKRIPRHPHVIFLENVFEDDECLYLIFEYADSGDLFSAICDAGGLVTSAAVRWILQLIDAIDHCHRRGIYHRDLKPENILLTRDGDLKLGDFGLATLDRFPVDKECGSAPYMAPEVASDSPGKYSAELADVWAVGVIFYNMLTGRNPWRRACFDDANFSLFMEDRSEFRARHNFAPEILAIFHKVFALNPKNRCSLDELRCMIASLAIAPVTPDRCVPDLNETHLQDSPDETFEPSRYFFKKAGNKVGLQSPKIAPLVLDKSDSACSHCQPKARTALAAVPRLNHCR